MSIHALTWLKQLPRGTFSPPQRFVMLVLAEAVDQDGTCYPGVRYLMKQTEMGESTIRRTLKELEDGGHIRRVADFRDNKSQTTNWYMLCNFTPDPDASSPGGGRRTPPLGVSNPPLAAGPAPSRSGTGGVSERDPQEEPSVDPLSSSKELERPQVRKTSRKSKPKPKVEMPANWTPTEDHEEYARAQGYDLGREVESFKADAIANDRRYAEWNMAFAKWLRSHYGHHRLGGPQRSAPVSESRFTKADFPAYYRRA